MRSILGVFFTFAGVGGAYVLWILFVWILDRFERALFLAGIHFAFPHDLTSILTPDRSSIKQKGSKRVHIIFSGGFVLDTVIFVQFQWKNRRLQIQLSNCVLKLTHEKNVPLSESSGGFSVFSVARSLLSMLKQWAGSFLFKFGLQYWRNVRFHVDCAEVQMDDFRFETQAWDFVVSETLDRISCQWAASPMKFEFSKGSVWRIGAFEGVVSEVFLEAGIARWKRLFLNVIIGQKRIGSMISSGLLASRVVSSIDGISIHYEASEFHVISESVSRILKLFSSNMAHDWPLFVLPRAAELKINGISIAVALENNLSLLISAPLVGLQETIPDVSMDRNGVYECLGAMSLPLCQIFSYQVEDECLRAREVVLVDDASVRCAVSIDLGGKESLAVRSRGSVTASLLSMALSAPLLSQIGRTIVPFQGLAWDWMILRVLCRFVVPVFEDLEDEIEWGSVTCDSLAGTISSEQQRLVGLSWSSLVGTLGGDEARDVLSCLDGVCSCAVVDENSAASISAVQLDATSLICDLSPGVIMLARSFFSLSSHGAGNSISFSRSFSLRGSFALSVIWRYAEGERAYEEFDASSVVWGESDATPQVVADLLVHSVRARASNTSTSDFDDSQDDSCVIDEDERMNGWQEGSKSPAFTASSLWGTKCSESTWVAYCRQAVRARASQTLRIKERGSVSIEGVLRTPNESDFSSASLRLRAGGASILLQSLGYTELAGLLSIGCVQCDLDASSCLVLVEAASRLLQVVSFPFLESRDNRASANGEERSGEGLGWPRQCEIERMEVGLRLERQESIDVRCATMALFPLYVAEGQLSWSCVTKPLIDLNGLSWNNGLCSLLSLELRVPREKLIGALVEDLLWSFAAIRGFARELWADATPICVLGALASLDGVSMSLSQVVLDVEGDNLDQSEIERKAVIDCSFETEKEQDFAKQPASVPSPSPMSASGQWRVVDQYSVLGSLKIRNMSLSLKFSSPWSIRLSCDHAIVDSGSPRFFVRKVVLAGNVRLVSLSGDADTSEQLVWKRVNMGDRRVLAARSSSVWGVEGDVEGSAAVAKVNVSDFWKTILSEIAHRCRLTAPSRRPVDNEQYGRWKGVMYRASTSSLFLSLGSHTFRGKDVWIERTSDGGRGFMRNVSYSSTSGDCISFGEAKGSLRSVASVASEARNQLVVLLSSANGTVGLRRSLLDVFANLPVCRFLSFVCVVAPVDVVVKSPEGDSGLVCCHELCLVCAECEWQARTKEFSVQVGGEAVFMTPLVVVRVAEEEPVCSLRFPPPLEGVVNMDRIVSALATASGGRVQIVMADGFLRWSPSRAEQFHRLCNVFWPIVPLLKDAEPEESLAQGSSHYGRLLVWMICLSPELFLSLDDKEAILFEPESACFSWHRSDGKSSFHWRWLRCCVTYAPKVDAPNRDEDVSIARYFPLEVGISGRNLSVSLDGVDWTIDGIQLRYVSSLVCALVVSIGEGFDRIRGPETDKTTSRDLLNDTVAEGGSPADIAANSRERASSAMSCPNGYRLSITVVVQGMWWMLQAGRAFCEVGITARAWFLLPFDDDELSEFRCAVRRIHVRNALPSPLGPDVLIPLSNVSGSSSSDVLEVRDAASVRMTWKFQSPGGGRQRSSSDASSASLSSGTTSDLQTNCMNVDSLSISVAPVRLCLTREFYTILSSYLLPTDGDIQQTVELRNASGSLVPCASPAMTVYFNNVRLAPIQAVLSYAAVAASEYAAGTETLGGLNVVDDLPVSIGSLSYVYPVQRTWRDLVARVRQDLTRSVLTQAVREHVQKQHAREKESRVAGSLLSTAASSESCRTPVALQRLHSETQLLAQLRLDQLERDGLGELGISLHVVEGAADPEGTPSAVESAESSPVPQMSLVPEAAVENEEATALQSLTTAAAGQVRIAKSQLLLGSRFGDQSDIKAAQLLGGKKGTSAGFLSTHMKQMLGRRKDPQS